MAITDQIHREKGGFAPLPEPLVFAITRQMCRKEPNPAWHYKDTRMSLGGTQPPCSAGEDPTSVFKPNAAFAGAETSRFNSRGVYQPSELM